MHSKWIPSQMQAGQRTRAAPQTEKCKSKHARFSANLAESHMVSLRQALTPPFLTVELASQQTGPCLGPCRGAKPMSCP